MKPEKDIWKQRKKKAVIFYYSMQWENKNKKQKKTCFPKTCTVFDATAIEQ